MSPVTRPRDENPIMSTTDQTGADTVRLAFTGVGSRGQSLLSRCIDMSDVVVPAVCDVQERHLDRTTEMLEDAGRDAPATYSDHEQMLAAEEIGRAHV